MAIKRDPLQTDAKGKCSRWRVIIYNPGTHKQEWHTINGKESDAKAFERQEQEKLRRGVYVTRAERRTVAQLFDEFIRERKSRARRTATIKCYETVARAHLLLDDYRFGQRDVGTVRRKDFAELFEAMLAAGASASTINRTLVTCKAMWFFALERELIERNPLQRFRPYQRTAEDTGRRVNRDAYSEAEVRAILGAARGHERPFVGLLVLAGLRPAEVYALRASDVDLEGGAVRIARSWDHRGALFVEPKTRAGIRTAPLSGWLVEEIGAHLERIGAKGEGLVFATQAGTPYNPSNVRRDLWSPVLKRAGVRKLDMYSLRHTFASLARSSGEAAFNVSRAMGHSRSTLVDAVYAHSLASGLAGVAERVAGRVFDEKKKPVLRVIEGGASPDVRQPLDNASNELKNTA
jgi:integrase